MEMIDAKNSRFNWVVITSEDNYPGGYIVSEYATEGEARVKAQQYIEQEKKFIWIVEKRFINN